MKFMKVEFMRAIDLYDQVDIEELWTKTGKPQLPIQFIHTNKGTGDEPLVRCRLVTRNFDTKCHKGRHDLFAAKPPPEGKKMLYWVAVVKQKQRSMKSNRASDTFLH